MPAETMVNTNELRFIARVDPLDSNHVTRILQQRWIVVGTLFRYPLTDENSEWRDVPLVTDVE